MNAVECNRPLKDGELPATEPGTAQPSGPLAGVVTGTLIGFAKDGKTPLVFYDGQPGTAALPARAMVDLHGAHIGREVVLMFDRGDPASPIVMGWLRKSESWTPSEPLEGVEVDRDGERLIITAKEQLVLRCGSASITLTRAGKVLIRGAYISSRASAVNRLQGGSVQIN
jgi:uncharacterized protein DUF6484